MDGVATHLEFFLVLLQIDVGLPDGRALKVAMETEI
jgi:hypothetical protein